MYTTSSMRIKHLMGEYRERRYFSLVQTARNIILTQCTENN